LYTKFFDHSVSLQKIIDSQAHIVTGAAENEIKMQDLLDQLEKLKKEYGYLSGFASYFLIADLDLESRKLISNPWKQNLLRRPKELKVFTKSKVLRGMIAHNTHYPE
jgi:isochorismate hydrolase